MIDSKNPRLSRFVVASLVAFSIVMSPMTAGCYAAAGTPDESSKEQQQKERRNSGKKNREKKDRSKKERKNTDAEKSAGAQGTKLDPIALKFANQNKWNDLIAHLQVKTVAQPIASRDNAWLAFAYMFMGKCPELKAMSEKARAVLDPAGSPTVADEAQSYAVMIQAYDEICATHYKDAERELALIPTWFRYDALVNFTLAALAGKQGRYADAVDYTERTVGAAPEFAWGYRTLGKLQQNRLKDPVKAQASYLSALAIEPALGDVVDAMVDMRLAKNNYDDAIALATNAIHANEKDSGNYYRLAQIYLKQWRLNEAAEELRKAIALDSADARFFRQRATIKRYQADLSDSATDQQRNLNDAIADQQRAVELSKDKPFELVELAMMNQAAGNTNRAADNLTEALKLDPNNSDAHAKLVALLRKEKRFEDLVAELQRYMQLKPKDVNAKIGLAKAYLDSGKTDLAIQQFKEASNLDPNNPDAHRELAAVRLKQHDYAAAAREYTHALNINPSSVPDLVALGYAYAQNDDYAQAEAAFVTALALQQLTQPNMLRTSPERLNLMRSLAVLLMDEGRYGEAAAQFESIHAMSKGTEYAETDVFRLAQAKALRDLTNGSASALVDLFATLPADRQVAEREYLVTTLLEARKPELAIKLIDAAPNEVKDSATYKILRGRALVMQGHADQAKIVVDKVEPLTQDRVFSQQSDDYLALSEVALAYKDYAAADAFALKAIEKNPKSYNAYVQRGRVSFAQNKNADALESAKKAIEINQYSTKAHILQGDALLAQGKAKEASASYKRAAELYPGLIDAHKALLAAFKKLASAEDIKREEAAIAQLEKQQ